MGAADRCEMRSDGVTVRGRTPLTCGYVVLQRVCRSARSVRIEGVRGSNPLSSTEKLQVSAPIVGATKPHHLADAAAALDVTLTDDEISALEEHYTPRQPTGY